ncbi:MAG: hypothetical protein U9Q80_04995 [Bacillota bacterium]|nr:hypothetical protein [Bacillota bacterium]
MRNELEKIEGYRGKFSGVFVRKGIKNGYKGQLETILLKDIVDSNKKIVANHLWFNYTKGFISLGKLEEGDVIEFNARVKVYEKGYQGFKEDVPNWLEYDYKLSHPSKVVRMDFK